MNRNITLILSAIIVVILLVIWIYLMFFSNNESSEVIEETGTFAEFDSLTGDETGEPNGFDSDDGVNGQQPMVDENGEVIWPILRQLTARNTIGYKEILNASSTVVVFAESGVGHIYSIDLKTGEETRVSATTIPDARQVEFSPNGKYVAVKTGDSVGTNPLSVGEIDYETNEIFLNQVDERVGDFTITNDGYVLFGSVTQNSVVVKSYNFETGAEKILFTTPFREVNLLFGENSTDSHYFQPKTSHLLEGFVYEVDNNNFERLQIDGFGFTVANLTSSLVTSNREQSTLETKIFNKNTEGVVMTETPLIPNKCVESEKEIYCAVPGNKKLQYNSIDKWLQGVDSYADNLWRVSDEFEQLINITEFSGRNVDVKNGDLGNISNDWYFQNKIDNSLWVYELSRLTEQSTEDTDI